MPRVSKAVRAAAATLLLLVVLFYLHSKNSASNDSSVASARRHEIESAFEHAWKGYSTHCMGHDALQPVSNTCSDDFGGWGASAIDALSTAIIMRKGGIASEILKFIETLALATLGNFLWQGRLSVCSLWVCQADSSAGSHLLQVSRLWRSASACAAGWLSLSKHGCPPLIEVVTDPSTEGTVMLYGRR